MLNPTPIRKIANWDIRSDINQNNNIMMTNMMNNMNNMQNIDMNFIQPVNVLNHMNNPNLMDDSNLNNLLKMQQFPNYIPDIQSNYKKSVPVLVTMDPILIEFIDCIHN